MTCLSICQNAIKSCGFAVPSTIIGNTSTDAMMLLALLNKAGRNYAQESWQVLQKEYTFNLVNGTASYAFPSDLGQFQNMTMWDRTQYWMLRGSLSPQEWQIYKSGIQTTTPRQRFRIKGNKIYIDPTPTNTDSIVIEYLSNAWVTDGSNFFTTFSADTQTSLIDEFLLELDLTWRFLERKGLAYLEAKDEADRYFEKIFSSDVAKNDVDLSGSSASVWPPLPSVPTTGFS